MLTRRQICLTALCLMGLSVATPVTAHDAPRVETVVKLSADETVDVTHTLQLSATQRLLFKAGIIDKNDMTGLRSRAQAALYASERFELNANGEPIKLDILGAEVAGGHLYIYQTGVLHEVPETWSARNSILRDLSPRFDNVVNVPTADGIRTIVFSGANIDSLNSPS